MDYSLPGFSWFSLANLGQEVEEVGVALADLPWHWEGSGAVHAQARVEELRRTAWQLSCELEQLHQQAQYLWQQAQTEMSMALLGAL